MDVPGVLGGFWEVSGGASSTFCGRSHFRADFLRAGSCLEFGVVIVLLPKSRTCVRGISLQSAELPLLLTWVRLFGLLRVGFFNGLAI